jgi:tetratricopeptide (TPR) repeat protein
MTAWPDYVARATALRHIEAQLASEPDSLALLLERADLLVGLGQMEAAKTAYLEILARDATHFGALNNLGKLAHALGHRSAARTAFAQAVAQHPDNPTGRVNLAFALADLKETDAARAQYEAALLLDPNLIEAHQGMANLLQDLGDEAGAWVHWRACFEGRPFKALPYRGAQPPITLLHLATVTGGNVPVERWLDDRAFQTIQVAVEFYDPALTLPPHDLILQAVGDVDRCPDAVRQAAQIVAASGAPVINRPDAVLRTGRAENAERLGALPGVRTPRIRLHPRTALAGPDAAALLTADGFAFPLLLRSPGYHTGFHFERVEAPDALPAVLAGLPGDTLAVLEFLDARSRDGKIRKYRAMFVDGAIYPLHAAVSQHWKVHYFSADMVENAEHRTEDAAFLADMEQVLGPHAMAALERIRDALGLDYGGIDFSLDAAGNILLYEANATMVVPLPGPDPRWDYRRAPVQWVIDAFHAMLITRARPQG